MTSLILRLFVLAVLAVTGCASQRLLIPPGQDPDQLAEEIARKGQGEASGEPVPPGSCVVGDVLIVGLKVGATCIVVPAIIAVYAFAKGSPSDNGEFLNGVKAIWSNDW